MALSAAQKAAQKRYKERNAERQRYYVAKSTALRFVEMASEADFAQLCERIDARRSQLEVGEKVNG
ncbi:hypothetical protein PQ472_03785 [Lacticaseibacillus pabuli]|uniref:Uncharacterized protein n=1 Tax=Lacticaseibacillus pabuli TaxID=3025672 RepID=A0ABY7WT87_9LACO|nr:hypothetical protein [Lacticaseibacillus sp. KACC 23028]WDF83370.1 hypothetical protein PQ472_03785 [Lacticaseibacillus sp. KACC 23028]